MYSQRDKPSSLNTITQNYVNSLREIQITDIASPYPATAKTFSSAPSMVYMFIYVYINILRGKKDATTFSRQACFVNRFTLQGFNERIFM